MEQQLDNKPAKTVGQRKIIRMLVLMELALGVVGLIWMYFSSISSPEWLVPTLFSGLDIIIGIGLGAVLVGLMLLSIRMFPSLGKLLPPPVKRLIRSFTVYDSFAISLAAGIGEEVLFRGALQPSLGLILASILFGLVHPASKLYIAVTMLIGLLIGSVFELSSSLYMVIALHASYDFIMIEILRRELRSEPVERPLFPAQPEAYPES